MSDSLTAMSELELDLYYYTRRWSVDLGVFIFYPHPQHVEAQDCMDDWQETIDYDGGLS